MKTADIFPGVKIGFLTVKAKTYRTLSSGRKMPAWSLRCDCGKVIVAMTVNLTKGKHQSCGCQKGALVIHKRGWGRVTKRPEYKAFHQMLERCHVEAAHNFPRYGGRGIAVCDRWRFGEGGRTGFQCFISDMGDRPIGMTLDRIDVYGGYSKGNCRWATDAQQRTNKRRSIHAVIGGVKVPLRKYVSRLGISYEGVRVKVRHHGMTPTEAARYLLEYRRTHRRSA